jgi:hypothetical protein
MDDSSYGFYVYLWSNPGNWVNGVVPGSGVTVVQPLDDEGGLTAGDGGPFDDIPNLTLTALDMQGYLLTVSANLTVNTLEITAVDTITTVLTDTSLIGSPAKLTIDAIVSEPHTSYSLGSYGAGAVTLDEASTDRGEEYGAGDGGLFVLKARPNAASQFGFSSDGTIAFDNPGAVVASHISDVLDGDAIELPGRSVVSVVINAVTEGVSSIKITTNLGTTLFSEVYFPGAPFGPAPIDYLVQEDRTTGLVKVTFEGFPIIAGASYTHNAWMLSGTAQAYATITVYDGKAKLGTADASAAGAWTFKTAKNDSAVRDFTATATFATLHTTSPASAAFIEGTPGKDTIRTTQGGDTITGGGGADTLVVTGHAATDIFVYKATSDSLDKAGAFDVITGFADKGNGKAFNDVIDLAAIKSITKFGHALASRTAEVAAHSVATFYDAKLHETLIFANAGASALSQSSGRLMEIELAGGNFKLTASNFTLA